MSPFEVLELRQELRLTKTQFAQWISVEPVTITRWESGRSPPKSTASAIMRAALEAIRQAPDPGSRSRVVAFLRRRARIADLVQDLALDVAKPRIVK